MRAPDPTARLYWFCGGDILRPNPETGVEPLAADAAARLHAFHLDGTGSASPAARDFHAARERELRLAIGALAAWRRAAAGGGGDVRLRPAPPTSYSS